MIVLAPLAKGQQAVVSVVHPSVCLSVCAPVNFSFKKTSPQKLLTGFLPISQECFLDSG